MSQTLALVEEKVEKVLTQLERLKQKNSALGQENTELRSELAAIKRDFNRIKLAEADKSDIVRTKLVSILERLSEFENQSA